MTPSAVQTRKLTLEEFLAMDFPEDGAKRELVNGEIVVTPAPNLPHKNVQSFLHEIFAFFKVRHPHYQAYSEFNLALWQGHHAIPDFAIARLEQHGGPCREADPFLEGPPDVVVEVLSPKGQWRDLVEKRGEYEQGNVPEYWIFDPAEGKALFLRLEAGRYREVGLPPDGVYGCASVPGLRLDVAAVFRNELAAGVAALGPGFGLSQP
jgi:Uma2 family endonuclease